MHTHSRALEMQLDLERVNATNKRALEVNRRILDLNERFVADIRRLEMSRELAQANGHSSW